MTINSASGALPLQHAGDDGRSSSLAQPLRVHAPEHDPAGTGESGAERPLPRMTIMIEPGRVTITT